MPGPGDGITSSDVETKPQGNDLLQVGRVVSGLLQRRACPMCCSASPRAGPAPIVPCARGPPHANASGPDVEVLWSCRL